MILPLAGLIPVENNGFNRGEALVELITVVADEVELISDVSVDATGEVVELISDVTEEVVELISDVTEEVVELISDVTEDVVELISDVTDDGKGVTGVIISELMGQNHC